MTFLLQRGERGTDSKILGMDLEKFPSPQVERLVKDRLLICLGRATSVPCDVPCVNGGPCRVQYFRDFKYPSISCIAGHVPSRSVGPQDVLRYKFSVARLISNLCDANGIIPSEASNGTARTKRFHHVGHWNTPDRSYSVFLALGLKPETFEADVAAIARLDGAKPLILSPTFRVSSPAFQRILKYSNAALWTLADVMTPQYKMRPPGATAPGSTPVATAAEPLVASRQADPILVVDRTGLTVSYKGHPVKLSRTPTRLLIVLAERAGQVVPYRELERRLYGDVAVQAAQLNNHKSEILAAFRKQLVGKDGITRAEIDALIETKSRVGYRLALGAHQVKIG